MIIVDRIKEIAASGTKGIIALVIVNAALTITLWSCVYIPTDPAFCTSCSAGLGIIAKYGISFDKVPKQTSLNWFCLFLGIFCIFAGVYNFMKQHPNLHQETYEIEQRTIHNDRELYLVLTKDNQIKYAMNELITYKMRDEL